jgi:uncharacterized membrane protein YfcA
MALKCFKYFANSWYCFFVGLVITLTTARSSLANLNSATKTDVARDATSETSLFGAVQYDDIKYCNTTLQCDSGLLCLNGTCSYCQNNEECMEVNSEYRCQIEVDVDREVSLNASLCKHKPLFEDFNLRDISATVIIFISGCFAAGAGVGGGGIFVPILILITYFDPKDAIPLSNTLIGAAAIANWIQMGRKRHPKANRPLIDYHLALIIQPLALGGTLIGFLLNKLFPNWLLLLLLVITLGATTIRTFSKGITLWKKEREESERQKVVVINSSSEVTKEFQENEKTKPLSDNVITYDEGNSSEDLEVEKEDTFTVIHVELEKILERERRTPWRIVFILFGILFLVLVQSLIVGSKNVPSIVGIRRCSSIYWLGFAISVPIFFLLAVFISRYLIRNSQEKIQLGYSFQEGDIIWTCNKTTLVGAISFLAGILAALLGIGGGLIISPILLEMGALPDVTAATSSFMILFTAFGSIIQFAIAGRIIPDYGMFFSVIGLLSSVVGQSVLGYFVQKYNRRSYIIFVTVLIIFLSTTLLFVSGLFRLLVQIRVGASLGFSNICDD